MSIDFGKCGAHPGVRPDSIIVGVRQRGLHVKLIHARRKRLLAAAGTVTGAAVLVAGILVAAAPASAASSVRGMDVSSHQGNVNWRAAWNNGARFAYVKATEGTYYRNPYFTQQYEGSYYIGMIRGAYHFARPDTTSGATQADYFVAHGGGWSRDGKTLPGMLDIEWNPYGRVCYGLSKAGMVRWIKAFSDEYHRRTTRWPVIYTATSWWSECTGNLGDFTSTNPLAVAYYSSWPGPLPYRWSYYTFWQYADHGVFPGDQDVFSASYTRLRVLATG
jgi:GH25 family lysozyme M1 (1,4-beta-N-acetylmuramidase)